MRTRRKAWVNIQTLQGDGIIVDQVRYMDLDTDEIEKGHRHYGLFIKRKSFAHEQELRATILLSKPGIGTAVPCDIDALIAQIHVFPQAPPYYADAVRYIVGRAHTKVTAPVVPSRLLDPPDYQSTGRAHLRDYLRPV